MNPSRFLSRLLLTVGLVVASAPAQALTSAQVRLLKDADYYVRNAARQVQTVQAAFSRTESARQIKQLRISIRHARQKLQNAARRLGQLPGGNARVAHVARQVKAQQASLTKIEGQLQNRGRAAAVAGELGRTSKFRGDVARLQEFGSAISRGGFFRSAPDRALALARQLDALDKFRASLAKAYGPLLGQRTAEAEQLRAELKQFDYRRKEFAKKVQKFVRTVPPEIREALVRAEKLGARGVSSREPALFRVGIPQQLGRAKAYFAQLQLWAPGTPVVKDLAASIAATEKRTGDQRRSLASEIIAANRPVPDRYQGADKAVILRQVRTAWLAKYPSDRILALAIPMRAWARETRWVWENDSLQKRDASDLQVAILVQADAESAITFRAYLRRDHLRDDAQRLRLSGKDGVRVHQRLLLENLRQ